LAAALRTGVATHPGRVRERNEDRPYADPARGIFIVVDALLCVLPLSQNLSFLHCNPLLCIFCSHFPIHVEVLPPRTIFIHRHHRVFFKFTAACVGTNIIIITFILLSACALNVGRPIVFITLVTISMSLNDVFFVSELERRLCVDGPQVFCKTNDLT
jgi:hypothetical protein